MLPIIGCNQNSTTSPTDMLTIVKGAINADTVWVIKDSPYIVTGNLIIESNAVLTIQPGISVLFDDSWGIVVKGILIADGLQNSESRLVNIITFTSAKDSPEMKDWKGIKFENTNNDKSLLRYVKIMYADTAIDCFSSSPQIMDCDIRYNFIGIYGMDCYSVIQHNRITDNVYGIWLREHRPLTTPNSASVTKNSILHNEIGITTNNDFVLTQNNINNSEYAVVIESVYKLRAPHNWWGSTNVDYINKVIWDNKDDPQLARVLYMPILLEEVIDAVPR